MSSTLIVSMSSKIPLITRIDLGLASADPLITLAMLSLSGYPSPAVTDPRKCQANQKSLQRHRTTRPIR